MTEHPFPISGVITLRGKTLRGKNRIRRGGSEWRIVAARKDRGIFLISETVGDRECFWATLPNDQHVEITRKENLGDDRATGGAGNGDD